MTQDRRAARRAAMPITSAFVEHYEREGLEARVLFASENGITYGKRPEIRDAFTVPSGYRMFVEPAKKERR